MRATDNVTNEEAQPVNGISDGEPGRQPGTFKQSKTSSGGSIDSSQLRPDAAADLTVAQVRRPANVDAIGYISCRTDFVLNSHSKPSHPQERQ
jgi:hypothetical protein